MISAATISILNFGIKQKKRMISLIKGPVCEIWQHLDVRTKITAEPEKNQMFVVNKSGIRIRKFKQKRLTLMFTYISMLLQSHISIYYI